MNIRLISADEMTAEQAAAWTEIQRSVPAMDSPYFHPDFTRAVAAVRDDVEIGVIEEDGKPVGFFPFQRVPGDVATPVGGKMSDFQAVVANNGAKWKPNELLEGCRLRAWRFDHLIASQTRFAPHHWSVDSSPYIDLADGWEGYRDEQVALRPEWFKRAERKLRQAEREAGPLSVVLDSDDPAAFHAMLKWKRRQYQSTGVTDVLAFDWTVALLERIRTASEDGFSGMTSVMYMCGVPTVVLFSMRSRGVLHAWFSAYHPDFAQFSPGIVFWMELLKACPQPGIRRIDLGKGPEKYKTRLMSGAIDVAEGAVDMRPMAGPLLRNCRRACDWTRQSPLRTPLLKPGRMIRRWIESRRFAQ